MALKDWEEMNVPCNSLYSFLSWQWTKQHEMQYLQLISCKVPHHRPDSFIRREGVSCTWDLVIDGLLIACNGMHISFNFNYEEAEGCWLLLFMLTNYSCVFITMLKNEYVSAYRNSLYKKRKLWRCLGDIFLFSKVVFDLILFSS